MFSILTHSRSEGQGLIMYKSTMKWHRCIPTRKCHLLLTYFFRCFRLQHSCHLIWSLIFNFLFAMFVASSPPKCLFDRLALINISRTMRKKEKYRHFFFTRFPHFLCVFFYRSMGVDDASIFFLFRLVNRGFQFQRKRIRSTS